VIRPDKIISGGQTGVDQAGLDAAMALGIPHGGWCPRGRRSENGPIPPCYNMKEMTTVEYPPRTRKNIEESDGTAVFTEGVFAAESGCALTVKICQKLEKPHLVVDLSRAPIPDAAKFVRAFVRDRQIKILNVAGSRASVSPALGIKVVEVLKLAFSEEPS
jgi:predicted Rossmann-fold nucleotide-binding protein